jgi:hypothetical protein
VEPLIIGRWARFGTFLPGTLHDPDLELLQSHSDAAAEENPLRVHKYF